MPITVYPKNYTNEVDLKSMSYTDGPGRSYRYYKGEPVFKFGQGLSYTTFSHSCKGTNPGSWDGTRDLEFSCEVTNTGAREGDEVVQVYASAGDAIRKEVELKHPVPIKKVVGFDRVRLEKGESAPLSFTVPARRLALTNAVSK